MSVVVPMFDLRLAHCHSNQHRGEVLASASCGCFSCLESFPSAEIREWIDGGQTALCPRCHVDAVVGSETGYLQDEGFLAAMHAFWFEGGKSVPAEVGVPWAQVPSGALIRDEEGDYAIRLGDLGAYVFVPGELPEWMSWSEPFKFGWNAWEHLHRSFRMIVVATGITGTETAAELQAMAARR